MIYAAFIGERDQWGRGTTALTVVIFIVLACGILNNYLGNQVIEATVYAVSKTDFDGKAKIEFSDKVKTEIESSGEILRAYEVAVYPSGSQRLLILSNSNNLWRWKWNKRELQLQIQPGKKYRFRVHRRWLGKNILDLDPE